MKLTTKRLKRLIQEELRKVLREGDEVLRNGDNLIIFSEWAQGHILRGHSKPGQGSIFKKVDMSVIMDAARSAPIEGGGGVYTVQTSEDIGYDLVLPMEKAMALPDAKRVVVQKEERSGPVKVTGIQTSAPLEKFATQQLSIVIKKSPMKFVPPNLQKNPEIIEADGKGVLYGVLSSWPGRGDVPRASVWGEDWAVILPNSRA